MADQYDVLTLEEAKHVLKFAPTDTSSDSTLTQVITAVSRRLDTAIGPTIIRSVTDEYHDGGRTKIELYYSPVSAVTAITEYQSGTAVGLSEVYGGTLPYEGWYGERYKPNPRLYSGIIVRKTGEFTDHFWHGSGNVVCSYSAGRSTSTTTVDDRIKEGAAMFLRSWWRAYEQSVAPMGEFEVPTQTFPQCAIPTATKEILRDMWLPQTGFGG